MRSDFDYHVLRKNQVTGVPRNVLYLDTETKTKQIGEYVAHRMKIAWTCSARYDHKGKQIREKYRYWKSPKDMWIYIFSLARKKTVLYLFAHNVFFDLQVSDFFYLAEKWEWNLEFLWEKGLTYILVITKDKRKLVILSSTNYFQASLAELGQILGYPKGKVDFEKVSREKLSSYCKRDVEILKRTMEFYFSFILEHDLGKFSYTIPAQAFRAFRHRFMNDRICIHNNFNVKQLERASYMGGRVEAFSWRKQREGPFITLDVNSMYPYVMKKYPYPTQLVAHIRKPSLDRVKDYMINHCVVAETSLSTGDPIYAARFNGKLIFPTGEFITFLTTPGLKLAFEKGHVKEVHQIALYDKAMLFGLYVDFFYALKADYRKQNNGIYATMAKLFLNSFYGKFGQKKVEEKRVRDESNHHYWKEEIFDLDHSEWVYEIHLLGQVIVKLREGEAPNAMVAIAAHVTEYARLYLWSLFERVGFDKVLYTDTDSLKIRKKDLAPVSDLLNDSELGMLGIKEETNQLDIMGAKAYKTEKSMKMKGVPQSAKKLERYRYQYFTFFNQTTHLNKGVNRYYLTRPTIKDVTPKYDKGEITKGGKIIPFQLQSPFQPLKQLPEPFAFFSNSQVRQLAAS